MVTPLADPAVTASVGLMICFDREVPEGVRCLRSLGAEVVLCPLACDTSVMDGKYYDYADTSSPRTSALTLGEKKLTEKAIRTG